MGLLDFIFGRKDDAPSEPPSVVSVSTSDVIPMARDKDGKQSAKQIMIPNRWAFVWAVRLEHYADHPQCREVFRSSILSNREGIRNVLGQDLLALFEETAGGDDPEDYRRLAPILLDVDRKMMTQ